MRPKRLGRETAPRHELVSNFKCRAAIAALIGFAGWAAPRAARSMVFALLGSVALPPQANIRTRLIHRPARNIISLLGGMTATNWDRIPEKLFAQYVSFSHLRPNTHRNDRVYQRLSDPVASVPSRMEWQLLADHLVEGARL